MLTPKTGRFLRTTHRFLATRINGYALKCAAISEMSHIAPKKSLKSIVEYEQEILFTLLDGVVS